MLKFAIPVLVGCLAPSVGMGQGLDGDFDQLSAKERSRIAKEEESGAPKDERYQAVMSEAEALFQQKRFDEALERFQMARDLRPYNVYPRVKIQDLQALIAKRDGGTGLPEPAGTTVVPDLPKPPVPHEAVVPDPGISLESPRELPPPPVDRSPQQRNDTGAKPSTAMPRTEPPLMHTERVPEQAMEPLEEGELIYKEGRAVVVERRITQEGRIVVFRKVAHPWGAVVYFKDATAVPERMWTEVFGSR